MHTLMHSYIGGLLVAAWSKRYEGDFVRVGGTACAGHPRKGARVDNLGVEVVAAQSVDAAGDVEPNVARRTSPPEEEPAPPGAEGGFRRTCELALEQHMVVVGAGDVAGAAGPRPAAVDGVLHGIDDDLVLAHAEIVVRAPHGHVLFGAVLAIARASSGDGRRALAILERVAASMPDGAGTDLETAKHYLTIGDQDLDCAIALFIEIDQANSSQVVTAAAPEMTETPGLTLD